MTILLFLVHWSNLAVGTLKLKPFLAPWNLESHPFRCRFLRTCFDDNLNRALDFPVITARCSSIVLRFCHTTSLYKAICYPRFWRIFAFCDSHISVVSSFNAFPLQRIIVAASGIIFLITFCLITVSSRHYCLRIIHCLDKIAMLHCVFLTL